MENYQHQALEPRMSWAAIWAGLFSTNAIGVLFGLLALSIGMAMFTVDKGVITAISVGGLAAYVILGAIAYFIGGMVTGFASGTNCCKKASLHGLVMWSVATILGVVFIAGGVSSLLAPAANLIGKVAQVTAESAGQLMPVMDKALSERRTETVENITEQANRLFDAHADKKQVSQTLDNILNADDASKQQFADALGDYLMDPSDDNAAHLHQVLKEQLVKHANMTEQQADEVISKWQQKYQQTMDKAKEKAAIAAEKGSNLLAGMAFGALITLLLGALASMGGAAYAARRVQKRDAQKVLS